MKYPSHIWSQLKNITADELIKALKRDDWARIETKRGATLGFRHPDRRYVVIHYHPKKTYAAGLLKDLLADIGWNEKDLRRLKLIK